MKMGLFKKYGDLAAGIVFLVWAIALYLSADALPASLMGGLGSDFMPKIIAIVTCILSFFQIQAGFKVMRDYQPEQEEEEYQPEYLRVLATIVAFTVYVFVLSTLGFVLSSIIYLFVQIVILTTEEQRTPKKLLLYAILSIVFCAAVYVIFRFGLSVMLPAGILG